MGQNERRGIATVPNLDGRSGSGLEIETPAGLLGRAVAAGPIALVLAGLVTTVVWAGFLAWCLFGIVRWALG